MKKNTSQKLHNRLVQYGALTTAMIGATDINGQIKYTDITDIGNPTSSVGIDFDGLDGLNEFVLSHTSFVQHGGLYSYIGALFIRPTNLNAMVLGIPTNSSYLGYPFALNSGDPISAANSNWNSAIYQWMNGGYCDSGIGPSHWCGVTNKFLGLKFDLADGTHYGWARMDVDYSGKIWTLYDYAYNETVDAPITAGQTTLSIDDNALSKIKIVALHKSIGLYNLQETTNYRLLNMTGQEVLKGTSSQGDHVIEATTLASGIYIVELADPSSRGLIRKKVVLK